MDPNINSQKEIRRVEGKCKVDQIVARLYGSPTHSFLKKIIQRPNSSFKECFSSPRLSKGITYDNRLHADVKENRGPYILYSPPPNPSETTREHYEELMRSFKSENNEESEVTTDRETVLSALDFRKSIHMHRQADRKNEAFVFKKEKKVMREIMKNFANQKQIAPPEVYSQCSVTTSIPSPKTTEPNEDVVKEENEERSAVLKSFYDKHKAEKEKAKEANKNKSKKVKIKLIENISGLIVRNNVWESKKNEKVALRKEYWKEKEVAGCTFSPNRMTKNSHIAKSYEKAVNKKTFTLMKEYFTKK